MLITKGTVVGYCPFKLNKERVMKDVILQDVLDYILKCKDNDKLVDINELLRID